MLKQFIELRLRKSDEWSELNTQFFVDGTDAGVNNGMTTCQQVVNRYQEKYENRNLAERDEDDDF